MFLEDEVKLRRDYPNWKRALEPRARQNEEVPINVHVSKITLPPTSSRRLDPNPDPAKCYPDMIRVIKEVYGPRVIVDGMSLDEFMREVSKGL